MKTVIISVTSSGDKIAENLSNSIVVDKFCGYNEESKINVDKFVRDDVKNIGIKNITERYFEKDNTIIFISSTGIAVRTIAPYTKSKDKDPAVIVIDSTGRFVISLLSGHLGGANDVTLKLASILGAEAIITTATDNLNIDAPDVIAKEKGYIIDDLKMAKEIASMLVNNQTVAYIEDFVAFNSKTIKMPKGYIKSVTSEDGLVVVTNKYNLDFNKPYLKLINKNIVLGIGCKKGIPFSDMREKIFKVLKIYNIDKRAVKSISTVEIKKNEEAILKMVDELKCDFNVFKVKDIKKVEHNYKGSEFVKSVIGVRAVAEPCVQLTGATLITEKLKLDGITLCIGVLK
ncbi:cobalamin biosynthesis protein CbiG [Clostridium botulinum C/D str. BKT12695]|nr:cobalamin biosynthesis protein CbiG [Clostridium botulinum C/D str. BKT12695]